MLVITLGVTGLSSVLLFLYFRNRIGQVEEKVDTMFQLIQNYESNRPPQFTVQENEPQGYYVQEENNVEQPQYVQEENANPNNDLIAVSDKNSESESEESDSDSEESDSDSEESEEDVKQLVLNNDEEKVNDVKVDDVEELDNLEFSKQHVELESLEQPKTIQIEENNDLDKLKVADLKNLCKEKGLSGYRNLRKNDLINLLSA